MIYAWLSFQQSELITDNSTKEAVFCEAITNEDSRNAIESEHVTHVVTQFPFQVLSFTLYFSSLEGTSIV